MSQFDEEHRTSGQQWYAFQECKAFTIGTSWILYISIATVASCLEDCLLRTGLYSSVLDSWSEGNVCRKLGVDFWQRVASCQNMLYLRIMERGSITHMCSFDKLLHMLVYLQWQIIKTVLAMTIPCAEYWRCFQHLFFNYCRVAIWFCLVER